MRKSTHRASQRVARRAATSRSPGTKAPRATTSPKYQVHQRLALVLHSMSDGFVMLDRRWRCLQVNTTAARLFQRAPQDLLGRPIHQVLHEFCDEPLFAQLRHSMDQRVTVEFEQHCDSPGLWYAVRSLPTGRDLVVFFRDVTQLHAQAEADRNLLAHLRHSFVHDLTAPLRAQVSFAELLLRRHSKTLNAEGRDYLHRILEGALRQADLIRTQAAQLRFTAPPTQTSSPTAPLHT